VLYGMLYFDVTFLFTPRHEELHFFSWTFPCLSFDFGCDTCWPTDVIRVERCTRSLYLENESRRGKERVKMYTLVRLIGLYLLRLYAVILPETGHLIGAISRLIKLQDRSHFLTRLPLSLIYCGSQHTEFPQNKRKIETLHLLADFSLYA